MTDQAAERGEPAAQDVAQLPGLDVSRPHPARMYDYGLGGKNHFAADRAAFDRAARSTPTLRTGLLENRRFLGRVVRYLAGEVGVRQFLDIGSGLPTVGNVHEVAQQVAPECRVVYVDNDPLVLAHAQALLASGPAGRTGYIQADLRDPGSILGHPVTRELLDFTEPIALMLVAVLHFLPDADNPRQIVSALADALPSGSYLAASHASAEHDRERVTGGQQAYRDAGVPFQLRDSDDFARLAFHGLELVPPGVVVVSEWRPDGTGPRPLPAEVNGYGGVGRKR